MEIAEAYRKLDQADKALPWAKKAAELSRNGFPENKRLYAIVLAEKGNFTDALHEAQVAVALDRGGRETLVQELKASRAKAEGWRGDRPADRLRQRAVGRGDERKTPGRAAATGCRAPRGRRAPGRLAVYPHPGHVHRRDRAHQLRHVRLRRGPGNAKIKRACWCTEA